MSRASDYAESLDAATKAVDALAVTAPKPWAGSGLTASVTSTGGLLLDRTVTLPPSEAASLGSWIAATFT